MAGDKHCVMVMESVGQELERDGLSLIHGVLVSSWDDSMAGGDGGLSSGG